MIAQLTGTISDKFANYAVVDVNGVGYKVFLSEILLSSLEVNEQVSLKVHSHIKEDQFSLFGFKNHSDLEVFEMLLEVSGIGPKTALLVVSQGSADKILESIRKADLAFFQDIQGIGKKMAQKIIVELQSKAGKVTDLGFESDVDNELIEALQNMGFGKSEARRMTKNIDHKLPLKERIKLSLRNKNNED